MTKYKVIVLSLILIVVVVMVMFKKNGKVNSFEITDIKRFSYSYSTGYMVNSRVRYEIDYKDDKYIATILPDGIEDEDKLQIEIQQDEINKIIAVFNKYDVSKWDGFNKDDKDVLDGNNFSFYLRMQDDKTIEASGYMKWPDNYGKVESELNSIFMEIYNNNVGKENELNNY